MRRQYQSFSDGPKIVSPPPHFPFPIRLRCLPSPEPMPRPDTLTTDSDRVSDRGLMTSDRPVLVLTVWSCFHHC